MKFKLNKETPIVWNGKTPLPNEISVMSYNPIISEFELLSIICALHGYLTAFDIITGADSNSEKDIDINTVLHAFRMYIFPRMPISNYSGSDKRIIKENMNVVPVNSNGT